MPRYLYNDPTSVGDDPPITQDQIILEIPAWADAPQTITLGTPDQITVECSLIGRITEETVPVETTNG